MADQETLFEFPCEFPVKIMGEMQEGFAEAMAALVRQHAPDFDPASIAMRPSSTGKYLSITITITARSRPQLDDLYRALTAHPMVKVAR